MKKLTFGSLLGLALLLGYGCNPEKKAETDTVETAEETNEAKTDTMADPAEDRMEEASEFLVKAASGGMMEVELGNLAQKNASNADVKAFGKRMVDDHSKANEEVKALAASKNITLPTAPGEDHQKHITDLSARKGVEFDKNYIGLMEKDHMEDINLFEEATKDEEMDPDIKAFAQKTLPTLRAHHEEAKKLDEKLNQ
jgi:putative membrane protein